MGTNDDTRARRISEVHFDYAAEPKTEWLPCNLCGDDRWVVINHEDRYGYPATSTLCTRCGLVMLNPRMEPTAYARFYESVYRPLVSAYHGRRIDATTIKDEQRSYSRSLSPILAPFLKDAAERSLLDVGGSTGVVARHLADEFGLSATVLDPAPHELAEAEASGIETIAGFVEDWDPAGRRFEMVGMFQTVDHLLDVTTALSKVRRLIADDGLFIMDIVDFRAAYLRNWSVVAATKVDHPYALVQETAIEYLRRSGFEPVRISYSPDKLHVLYVCRVTAPQHASEVDADVVSSLLREIRFVQNAPVRTPIELL